MTAMRVSVSVGVSLVLYCTVPYIAICVDASGMVFWDRPVRINPRY